MSKLDGIFISGIRSFGIDEKSGQKFTFFTPLTLFQGQNGCGKTTIMEAIRYACTGELPGGPKSGQGFVSDPYMHNVLHVLGQIKLKIKDVRGNEAIISRVMKCEKNYNGGLKFSTLDTMVRYVKANGMSEELSGRSADINSVIVHLMGVSPAILNNVLLCHQEHSLWPLGESAQLKKKFDEIFDSTNYNKCVDTLRKDLKNKTSDLKILAIKMDYHKKVKEEVESKKVQLTDKETKLEKQNTDIENLERKLLPIDKRLVEISELENTFLDLQKKKSRMENEIKNLNEMQDNIKKNLQNEFAGSDEELQKEIDSFDAVREKQTELINEAGEERNQVEKAESAATEAITKKTTKLVQTQEEKKSFDAKVLELEQGIENLGKALKCDLEDAENNAAIKILGRCIEEENQSLNKQIVDFKNVNGEKQSAIDKCREKCVQTEQEKRMKSEEVNTCKKQLREFKMKLKDLDISDEKLKSYQRNIEKIDKDLESLANSFNEEKVSKEIDDDKKRIKQLDSELDEFECEYKIRQKNSVTDNEIENLKSDVSRWKNDIEKIKHKYFDEFKLLLPDFPESEIKQAVTNKISEANRSVAQLTKEINGTQNAVTKLETERNFAEKEFKKLGTELKQSQNEIELLCGATDYKKKCDELELSFKDFQRKKGQWSSAKILYEKFVEDISNSKCCPVCSTNFSSKQSAVEEIIKTIHVRIKDIPSQLQKVEIELNKHEGLYKKLIGLKSVNSRIKELTEILPEKQEKITRMENDCSEKKVALEKLSKEIKPLQEITVIGTKIIGGATLIDQNKKNIENAEERIVTLQAQLIEVDTSRSMYETETAISNIKDDLTSLREKCEKNQKRLNENNKRCQTLRENRNSIFQKQLNLQKDMQGKPQLLERIKEIEEREKELLTKIDSLDELFVSQKTDLEEAKYQMETVKAKNESILDSARSEYNKHKNDLSDINKVYNSIKNISADDLERKFNDILNELADLKCRKDDLVVKKNELTERINEIKMEIASEELNLRNLKDNQELRTKRKRKLQLDSELEELNKKIGKQNFTTVFQEKKALNIRKTNIERDMQMKIGEKTEMEKQIQEIKEDLAKPSNCDIYTIYRNIFIRYRVMEVAIKNIKIYAESLENAICVYHRTRMAKINNHIRELWTNIYRGSDIDYIRIDTDISFTAGRRNYKYQVMQKKNETLLEMRGRCSAGQKVLASLIIRMALAETFSTNCGILALDEPTTNLDSENIASLSNALVNIINSRRGQKNFQLLIITHDETFLESLRGVNSMRNYYKVKRNAKNESVVTLEVLV